MCFVLLDMFFPSMSFIIYLLHDTDYAIPFMYKIYHNINYIEQNWTNILRNISQYFLHRWPVLSTNLTYLPSRSIKVALTFTISIKSKQLLIDSRKNSLFYLLFLIGQFNRSSVHNDMWIDVFIFRKKMKRFRIDKIIWSKISLYNMTSGSKIFLHD